MITVADNFELAIHDYCARVLYDQQERRIERWCREYAMTFGSWRDAENRPWVHTYFYPAEQYDKGLLQQLASH